MVCVRMRQWHVQNTNLSVRIKPPSLRTGSFPRGLSFRNSGVLCWPASNESRKSESLHFEDYHDKTMSRVWWTAVTLSCN